MSWSNEELIMLALLHLLSMAFPATQEQKKQLDEICTEMEKRLKRKALW